jgi:hypothetical protein
MSRFPLPGPGLHSAVPPRRGEEVRASIERFAAWPERAWGVPNRHRAAAACRGGCARRCAPVVGANPIRGFA